MAAYVTSARYSAEDFETASVRSAAPSYLSEAPSYHSNTNTQESIPAYTPRTTPSFTHHVPSNHSRTQSQLSPPSNGGGLPPVPARPAAGVPHLPNFRIPNWSANTAVAARQYRNVAERRVTDGRYGDDAGPSKSPEKKPAERPSSRENEEVVRPLEDPYLVGEVAAAKARRERIARETGDDILILEDQRWDWLLSQMKDWDERERSFKQFRREIDSGHRKRLMRRITGAR